MADAYLALIGFTAWTLLLPLLYVGVYRVGLVLSFRKPANAWPRGAQHDDPPVIKRLHDAHMNCVENLPVFAAIVLAAALTEQMETVNQLALWVLGLRVAQGVTHLIGTSAALVFVRANFYILQMALFIWMLISLV